MVVFLSLKLVYMVDKLFQDMIENEKFNPGSELEKECIWFSFSGIIQKDLDFVKEHWNTPHKRFLADPMNCFACLWS